MHRYLKMLIVSITAASALAIAVSAASARQFEVSSTTLRAGWSSLEMSNTFGSGVMRCPITMEGSLHSRTISKVSRSLLGYITRSFVNLQGCTGGRVTIRNETLPWHLTYESFAGTLPNISSVKLLLIRAGFIYFDNLSGNTCSFISEPEEPASMIMNVGAGGVANSLTFDSTRRIRLNNAPGGIFCGLGSVALSGTTNTLTVLNSSTRITISLI